MDIFSNGLNVCKLPPIPPNSFEVDLDEGRIVSSLNGKAPMNSDQREELIRNTSWAAACAENRILLNESEIHFS
jgi:hypothetical protein